MFSKTVQERIPNWKYWSETSPESSFQRTFFTGSGEFQLLGDGEKFYLEVVTPLESEEMAVIELMLDFLMRYPKDRLAECRFREFDYYLRDSNTQSPFPENYQTNHIEQIFSDVKFIFGQDLHKGLKLEHLSKIQRILTLEQFINAQKEKSWGDDVEVNLVDIEGKNLFLEIKAPGDLELYLDKIQESLIDFFHDYDLNCILSNNISFGGAEQ